MISSIDSQAESLQKCTEVVVVLINPTYRTAMSWFSGSGALDTFNGLRDKVQSKVNNIDTDKLLKNLTLQSGILLCFIYVH